MRAVRVRCRHFQSTVDSQVAYIIFRLWDEYESSSVVGGLMRGRKIPQQDFALKRQGGLMREGAVFAGHYGITDYLRGLFLRI